MRKQTVLFEGFYGGLYAFTDGRVRYCANRKRYPMRTNWINLGYSVPSSAKRLCVVYNFKEM